MLRPAFALCCALAIVGTVMVSPSRAQEGGAGVPAGNGKMAAGGGKMDAGNGKMAAGSGKMAAGNGKMTSSVKTETPRK